MTVVVVAEGAGRAGSVVLVVAGEVDRGATGAAVVAVVAAVGISIVVVLATVGISVVVVLAAVGISIVVVLAIAGSGRGEATVAGGTASSGSDALVAWRLQAASTIRRSMTAQRLRQG